MQNHFGQEIEAGDYVGLGVRKGNGTEQRVGKVVDIIDYPVVGVKARCIWFDSERDQKTFITEQDFWKLWKIEKDTVAPKMVRYIEMTWSSL